MSAPSLHIESTDSVIGIAMVYIYIYMYNRFLVFTDGEIWVIFVAYARYHPCLCLPCFYAFRYSNPYIFQQFTENVFTLG